MTPRKIILLACLFFFCLAVVSPTITSAANYQMSEAQLMRYEQALQTLKSNLETLRKNSKLSEEQLAEAKQSQQRLAEALKDSRTSTENLERLLTNASAQLENLKLLAEKLEKENKLLRNKVQILTYIAIGELIALLLK